MMKIAIPSKGRKLSAEVHDRFGRAKYFLIVDLKTNKVVDLPNPYLSETSGVGIKAASLLAKNEVNIVITSRLGLNALIALQAADIEVFTGAKGTVSEVLDAYKNGQFKAPLPKMARINGHFYLNFKGRGLGPKGECVCRQCGFTMPHKPGVPCNQMRCPQCGGRMRRR